MRLVGFWIPSRESTAEIKLVGVIEPFAELSWGIGCEDAEVGEELGVEGDRYSREWRLKKSG